MSPSIVLKNPKVTGVQPKRNKRGRTAIIGNRRQVMRGTRLKTRAGLTKDLLYNLLWVHFLPLCCELDSRTYCY